MWWVGRHKGGGKLNYIQQIRAFDDFRLYKSKLSSGQVALWYSLMSINNKTSWQTWFTAANATLESLSGLSRSGIAKDRNMLKQLGLIDFKSNGRQATSYHVCVLYTSDSVQGSVQDSAHNSTQDSTHRSAQRSSALVKQNKTETKLKKNNKETDIAEPELTDADLTLEFLDFWEAYPRQEKKQKAFNEYVFVRNSGVSKELLVKKASDYAKSLKLHGSTGGYVSMPENWLKEKRWTDEYDLTPVSNDKGTNAGEPRTRKDWVG